MRLWTQVDVTDPDQVDAALIATEVLDSLSGRRWTGPVRLTEEYVIGNRRATEVQLRRTPVTSIESVKINGEYADTSRMELLGQRSLRGAFPPCARLSVTYTAGGAPPYGARRAAEILTQELLSARVAPDDCRLPDRVTSISRQGVSYTILDPQDFLDNGRTGLYEIDIWLKSVNPDKARRKARVIRPDAPRGRTVTPLSGRGSDPGAAEYDLRVTPGAELALTFNWTSDGVANVIGAEWDVVSDVTPFGGGVPFSLTPFIAVEPDAVRGRLDLTIPASSTTLVPSGRWRLDLVRRTDATEINRLLYGDVERVTW